MKLCLLLPLAMASATPYVYAQQADDQKPDISIKRAIDDVMSAIRTDPGASAGDPDRLDSIVREKFLPHTDFLRTTEFAAGNAWSQATPEQQKELFEQFQILLVHVYGAQLSQVRAQDMQFKFLPMAPLAPDAKDAVVKTIYMNRSDQTNINYRVVRTDSGWKIYDIDMGGAWLSDIYQQQFAGQIDKGGIEGLLKSLRAHNAR